MNQTLEKSSLANLTDSLAAVFDDKYRGMGQLMASNTTPYVPFNWWLTQFDDLTNEGEFNGKPNNIMERFGKTIRPLKLLGMGVLNKERDALGRLMPSTSRGFNPFVSREFKFDAISDEIGDIMETHGTEFKSPSFERSHIPFQEINAGDGRSIYDHMQESLANGEITIGGLTLEQAANTMISSDKYQDDYKAWQGLLGQNRNACRCDLGEAAGHNISVRTTTVNHGQDTGAQCCDGRCMISHRCHVAICARDLNLGRLDRCQTAFGRDQIEL